MKYLVYIIFSLILIVVVSAGSNYNGLVKRQEATVKAWANVENAYQYRSDLIPNLVNVVKGYAAHEEGTLTAVVEARSKATSVSIDNKNIDAESLQRFGAVQEDFGSSLSRLMMMVERYPELRANENFLDLQEKLEATENRITYVRGKFNEVTRKYNRKRRRFPTILWVNNLFPQFEERAYFKAADGSEYAANVEF